ncbi:MULTISPECIES: Sec-independent protein translocase protein TatB [unclassified Ensifer]|uniref:Sec-independent protein translocase protein TatB n=1 Tax=unclassified Ensifer TaxID=2633371 RepID=UPI000813C60B|nr:MULTISPECIES: Sec-independent protein translocase protein TatB [unclassified Ensifer]OCP00950.1 twin arginine-targeting protein translocase TatB [Ensifer sp. LC11]OCP01522.1 twin arginine-targeting protein translocase TatB [Ensifer sp. LC13]OCP02070.1 twin arginine-targeting protein translocase TatB [Ensifer sp. LC14]OCP30098.1 twin arginine-targeting protein translocase TatB [Ensifer sp. LC499]
MLDIGWTELVVIAIVLIVVVGPKDLPPMLRAFGRMTAKLRGMASEFRHQFDEALREADLDEVRKTISDAQSLNPANALREAINPLRQMGNEIKSDLQKAATPDRPAPTSSVEPVTAAEPVAAAPVATVEAKPSDTVAAAAIGSANRQMERSEVVAAPAEKPKRASRAKVDAAPAAKKTAAPKAAAAAAKSAAPKTAAPNSSAKVPATPVAEKSKATSAAQEPFAKTSKPRATARKKGEA